MRDRSGPLKFLQQKCIKSGREVLRHRKPRNEMCTLDGSKFGAI